MAYSSLMMFIHCPVSMLTCLYPILDADLICSVSIIVLHGHNVDVDRMEVNDGGICSRSE